MGFGERARGAVAAGLLTLGSLSLAPTIASAQDPDKTATEEADRARRESGEATGASGESRAVVAPSGVTYQDILKDPDNVELNVAYARDQVAAGDLKGASATLERVLLIAPGEAQVRAFYGLVLYRLQDYDRTKQELKLALMGPLPPDVRRQAEYYLDKAEAATRVTRFALTITSGVQYDNNMNQSPADGNRLSFDTVVPADEEEDDWASLTIATLDFEHDLGFQDAHKIVGGVSFYNSDKFHVDEIDLTTFGANLGIAYNLWRATVTPKVVFDHFLLDEDPFLTRVGGELDFDARLTPALLATASAYGVDEDYRDTGSTLFVDERDGARLIERAALTWAYGQHFRVKGELNATQKFASESFEEYNRFGARLSHTWLLGSGHFILTNAAVERTDYDEANARYTSSEAREDTVWRVSGAYGVPLDQIFGEGTLPELLGRVNVIGQVEYENSDSNIPNFDYDSTRVQFVLTRRFDF